MILQNKKEQILEATLKIIAKNNNTNVTIREIAREANVNVSAINYYYTSKEQLLIEVENLFNNNFVDAFSLLDEEWVSPEDQLIEWFSRALSFATRYPGVMVLLNNKMQTFSPINKDVAMGMAIQNYLTKVFKLFVKVCSPPAENSYIEFIMFGSSVLCPVFLQQWNILSSFMFDNEKSRKDYIRNALQKFKN